MKMGKIWYHKLVIIWDFKRFLFYWHNCTKMKYAERNDFIFSCFVFLLIYISWNNVSVYEQDPRCNN